MNTWLHPKPLLRTYGIAIEMSDNDLFFLVQRLAGSGDTNYLTFKYDVMCFITGFLSVKKKGGDFWE